MAPSASARPVYVTSSELEGSVSAFDTRTGQAIGSPIPAGNEPQEIAITPDGKTAYVAVKESRSVVAIDTRTNTVVGAPIPVGQRPLGVAITPDGKTAYIGIPVRREVIVFDTQRNVVVGSPIALEGGPTRLAITPDGRTAYVTGSPPGNVAPISIGGRAVSGAPIPAGPQPFGIAIVPDQPPLASFSAPAVARPGVPLALDASSSRDPDSSIATYGWAFGDGQGALAPIVVQRHVYATPGRYEVKLTVSDDEGCSTAFLFTGQTASCNGSSVATQTRSVEVLYPGVRVRCPKAKKRAACRIRLQVVSKRRKGKAQSAVARARLKPGRSSVVSLKPKPAFNVRIAAAKQVLVRMTVTAGRSERTRYRVLKIVQ